MIQIKQTGLVVDQAAIQPMAEEFRNTGLVMLPRFVAPGILSRLLKNVAGTEFGIKKERFIEGTTLHIDIASPALASVYFMLNRPELFELVGEITGKQGLKNFTSRLHRTVPDPTLQLDWHDDGTDGRMVGLNISLSDSDYTGGLLQLRSPDKELRGEVGRLAPGDAFLFRIGDGWDHRLTPVESGVRTVIVGWFRSYPDWIETASAYVHRSVVGAAS